MEKYQKYSPNSTWKGFLIKLQGKVNSKERSSNDWHAN